LVANGEAERLEKDLAHARTAALANGMGVKSRLQALQFTLSAFTFFETFY
jgi:kinetochore protein NDC80